MNDDEIDEILRLDELAKNFSRALVVSGLPLDHRARLAVELAYMAGYKKANEESKAEKN